MQLVAVDHRVCTPVCRLHCVLRITVTMELTWTDRGATKLLYEGYAYVKDKSYREMQYWRCERKSECRARLKTDLGITTSLSAAVHNHPPNPANNVCKKAVAAIRATAAVSQETTSSLVDRCVQDVTYSTYFVGFN